jgi:hypothetical protein
MKSFISSSNLYAGKFIGSVKFILLALFLARAVVFAPSIAYAGDPLTYGYDSSNSGDDADTSNNQVTVPFMPTSVCITNDGSVNIFYDLNDGTATTDNDSENLTVKPSETVCHELGNKQANDTLVIGVITASSASHFRIHAIKQQ